MLRRAASTHGWRASHSPRGPALEGRGLERRTERAALSSCVSPGHLRLPLPAASPCPRRPRTGALRGLAASESPAPVEAPPSSGARGGRGTGAEGVRSGVDVRVGVARADGVAGAGAAARTSSPQCRSIRCAAEDAPRDPFTPERHGLAEIVERGTFGSVERQRVCHARPSPRGRDDSRTRHGSRGAGARTRPQTVERTRLSREHAPRPRAPSSGPA